MKKTFLILFNLLMLILNIFVGPSIKDSMMVFLTISNIISFIYLISNYKKNEFTINKLDIIVILFLMSPIIPLVFGNYVSVDATYRSVIEGITLINIYYLSKNLNINNKEKILDILIFSSIPVIIIAFDRMYMNLLWNKMCELEIFKVSYIDSGLLSNFNYPNSLAIYLSSILILVFGRILSVDNNKKMFVYYIYAFLLSLVIILTESKASICLLFLFIIIYIFTLKDKDRIIKLLLSLFSGIIIYFIIYNCFGMKIIALIVSIILFLISIYLIKYININLKRFSLISLLIIVIFLGYFLYFKGFSKPLVISDNYIVNFKKITKKDSYKIKLNLSNLEKDSFKVYIFVVDDNGYREKYIEKNIQSNNEEYFLSNIDDIRFIEIKFEQLISSANLVINNIYIDDKEYIINYKYIPNKLAKMINSFNINEPTIKYRIDYYKDCFKLIKDNIFTGSGARAWEYKYKSIQSYNYATKEVHNFVLDVFLEYGLFSFILLLIIIGILIKLCFRNIKDKNIINISICYSLFILFIHSCIDFDMSFLLIKIYFFILISILSNNITKSYKVNNKNIIISLIVIAAIILLNILNSVSNILNNNDINASEYKKYSILNKMYPTDKTITYNKIATMKLKNKEKDYYDKDYNEKYIENIIKFIEYEPYYNQSLILTYLIEQEIYMLDNNYIYEEYILKIYKLLKTYPINNKYDFKNMNYRVELLIRLIESYENTGKKYNNDFLIIESKKIRELIIDEYNINTKRVNSYKETKYSKESYNNLIEKYKNIVEKV